MSFFDHFSTAGREVRCGAIELEEGKPTPLGCIEYQVGYVIMMIMVMIVRIIMKVFMVMIVLIVIILMMVMKVSTLL